LLQLFQSGIQNVVATSGTALTGEHARLIRRYTNRVYLCYDADSAGVNAAVRGGEVLFQQLLEAEVLILPSGEDPDSYVKKHGKDAFLEFLKEAQDYLAFRLDILKQKYDLQKAAERSQAVTEMLEMLLPIQDNIRISFYVEKLAEHLQIPSTTLLNEFKKKKRAQFQRQNYSARSGFESQSSREEKQSTAKSSAGQAPLVFTGAWGGEKDVILLLLSYFDDIHEYVFAHLQEDDFLNPEFKELFSLIKTHQKSGSKNLLHSVLENTDSEALRTLIVREMEQSNREFSKPALYLQDCIKQIKIA